MSKQNYDCPHCGQDLRLSPGAEDEIENAKVEGFIKAVKEINKFHKLKKGYEEWEKGD